MKAFDKHLVDVHKLDYTQHLKKATWKGISSLGSKIEICYQANGNLWLEIDGNCILATGLNPKEHPGGQMDTLTMLKEFDEERDYQQFKLIY